MENLYNKRKIYKKNTLLEEDLAQNPIDLFRKWYLEAETYNEILEANAMSISTIDEDGCPRTRMVLMKSFDNDGIVFFTNYKSKKGIALEHYPKACLLFYWSVLERQVIIKACVEKTTDNESDKYFYSRPLGSQLGAIVSNQSQIIPNRDFIDQKLNILIQKTEGKKITRPHNWGGYIAKPYEIEFWQGRENRLHDRIMYRLKSDNHWMINRLSP